MVVGSRFPEGCVMSVSTPPGAGRAKHSPVWKLWLLRWLGLYPTLLLLSLLLGRVISSWPMPARVLLTNGLGAWTLSFLVMPRLTRWFSGWQQRTGLGLRASTPSLVFEAFHERFDHPAAPPGSPAHLVLLFHGVGATAAEMALAGRGLARTSDHATVLSVATPLRFDFGDGRQWFSVQGVTEQKRAEQIAQTMPSFIDRVQKWSCCMNGDAARAILIGPSQGAIMALESTQLAAVPSGRVVAIAGWFARPEHRLSPEVRVHLMYGEQDNVIPLRHSIEASERLAQLAGSVMPNLFPGLSHGIDERVLGRMSERLAQSMKSAVS